MKFDSLNDVTKYIFNDIYPVITQYVTPTNIKYEYSWRKCPDTGNKIYDYIFINIDTFIETTDVTDNNILEQIPITIKFGYDSYYDFNLQLFVNNDEPPAFVEPSFGCVEPTIENVCKFIHNEIQNNVTIKLNEYNKEIKSHLKTTLPNMLHGISCEFESNDTQTREEYLKTYEYKKWLPILSESPDVDSLVLLSHRPLDYPITEEYVDIIHVCIYTGDGNYLPITESDYINIKNSGDFTVWRYM